MNELKKQLTSENFVKEHWHKKPYLFKAALQQSFSDLTANQLQEMWENPYFYSKIISFDNAWHVMDNNETFDFNQNNIDWTLLVHNTDKYYLSVKDLLKSFDSFPKWTFDDVMASLSNQGSISPAHIDNYSVFIVQVEGERSWELQSHPTPGYIDEHPVRILKNFEPDQTVHLKPGDILYIPPGVAHQGKSVTDSLSLSVGIQSLNLKDVLFQHIDSLEFLDSFHLPSISPGRIIKEHQLMEIKSQLVEELIDNQSFNDSLLSYLTRSTDAEENEETDIEMSDFEKIWKEQPLCKDELVELVAIEQGSENLLCSVKEIKFVLTKDEFKRFESIFDEDLNYLIEFNQYVEFKRIIYNLYLAGIFFHSQD